jgi:hypothetical protein
VGELSHTARLLFAAGSVEATLRQVVAIATATIESCEVAGICLPDVAESPVLVFSDPENPDVEAFQRAIVNQVDAEDRLDPRYFYDADLDVAPAAAHVDVVVLPGAFQSFLALRVAAGGPVGALGLYSRGSAAFDVIDRGKAVLLAALAGVALVSAQEHADERRHSDNLAAALASRETIGQAQGILMERERVTADEAFDILRRASQHLNRKLKEVAQDLVETGERPDTGVRQLPPSDAS